ncbi:hypothetical protein K4A83_09440 [Spirulina subsalsa FACHB-351]|uniref:Sulfotransferase n=1 Tax=Spirulina subsalsa FACHB-351 TaxID=234711 RepID=A0ABT3L4R1_9CYAN|nr:hypothetical protein [Spirulina subsalsa]MCW6036488.1 hypothetical protein [Spirulina subsalsa FACHB-351]
MSLKFHFVVGVEGTGHHMIRAVLSNHINQSDSVFEGKWHKILAEHWDCELRLKNDKKLFGLSKNTNLKKALRSAFEEYKQQNVIHLFENSSFPYEQPRATLRRPDIIEFSALMEDIQDCVEVQYLILYRNPISATYSAIRRKFTDNIYLQAKIAESNFIYIERQFSTIPKDNYRVIHFEEFLDQPEEHLRKLADWWRLDYKTVAPGLLKLRKPSGLSKVPEEDKEFLESFFNSQRIAQWEGFYNSNKL